MDIELVSLRRSTSEREAKVQRTARWQSVRPSSAQVYIENKCHLKCEHCYESEESHPTSVRMSLEDYERLFDSLAQLGVLYLTLTGGEIFLRRDIFQILTAAKKRRFAITLFTSGTLLNEEKVRKLAALKLDEVHISVYSHDPAVHDRFTQTPKSHARSVAALRLLREHGVRTVLKANLTRFNIDDIDALIALAHDVDAQFQFDPAVRRRMDGDARPLEYALSPDEIRRKILSRPDLVKHFRKTSAESLCSGETRLLEDDQTLCGAGVDVLSIGADGGVYACGFFPNAAGNLADASLEEIWFGAEQLDEIRSIRFRDLKPCGTCAVRSTCSPCMAQAQIEQGDLRGCNDYSHRMATATHLLAENKERANQKMARGQRLPVVQPQSANEHHARLTSPRLSGEP